jgi:hypothetical protein
MESLSQLFAPTERDLAKTKIKPIELVRSWNKAEANHIHRDTLLATVHNMPCPSQAITHTHGTTPIAMNGHIHFGPITTRRLMRRKRELWFSGFDRAIVS